jgi:hypothetical protein
MQQRAATGYDTDFALWVEDQVAALRAGRFGDLDVTNLVEELESLSKRDRNEVLSRLTVRRGPSSQADVSAGEGIPLVAQYHQSPVARDSQGPRRLTVATA